MDRIFFSIVLFTAAVIALRGVWLLFRSLWRRREEVKEEMCLFFEREHPHNIVILIVGIIFFPAVLGLAITAAAINISGYTIAATALSAVPFCFIYVRIHRYFGKQGEQYREKRYLPRARMKQAAPKK